MTPTKRNQDNNSSAEQRDEATQDTRTTKPLKRKLFPSPVEDAAPAAVSKKRRYSADDAAFLQRREPPWRHSHTAELKRFRTVPLCAKKRAASPPPVSEPWRGTVAKKQRLFRDGDASRDSRAPSPADEEKRLHSSPQKSSCSPPSGGSGSLVHSEEFWPSVVTGHEESLEYNEALTPPSTAADQKDHYDERFTSPIVADWQEVLDYYKNKEFTPSFVTDLEEGFTYDELFTPSIVSDEEGCPPLFKEDMDKARRELSELGVRLLERQELAAMTAAAREELGRGAYGSCIKTLDPHTQQQVVVKTFFRYDFDSLLAEAKNLHHLQMAGVQRLVGVCVDACQLLTHYAGDTATHYFQKPVPLADAAAIFLQLARALKGIVERGFTHNDVKGDNVCVSDEGSGPSATVIDLGLARPAGVERLFLTRSAPERYPWLPPELLTHARPTSEASDVYLLATTMAQLLASEEGSARAPLPAALAAWMEAARRPDPARRPTLAALVHVLEALLE